MKIARVFVALALASPAASACSCVEGQPFCAERPAVNESTVIFRGRVTRVYPFKDFEQYGKEFIATDADKKITLQDLKDRVLNLWSADLSPQDVARIQSSTDTKFLEKPLPDLSWSMPRKVTLEVAENFAGSAPERVDVFTGIGMGDCGVPFEDGEEYLVIAGRTAAGRWTTSICAGTTAVRFAQEDVNSLRDWKAGKTPAPRVYGNIQDWTRRTGKIQDDNKPLSAHKLTLRAGSEVHEATTDEGGNFVFGNLNRKIYQLETGLPDYRFGNGNGRFDLTKVACVSTFLYIQQEQGSIAGRVRPVQGALPENLWIAAIPVSGAKSGRKTISAKKDGSFLIDELEPGDYHVTINVADPPYTQRGRTSLYGRISPYPPMYLPGVPTPEKASIFHVERTTKLTAPTWTLPQTSGEREILVTVQWPSGEPAAGARLLLAMPGRDQVVYFANPVGPDGRLYLYGVEGVSYEVRAAAQDAANVYFKGRVIAGPDANSVIVRLEKDGATPSEPGLFLARP